MQALSFIPATGNNNNAMELLGDQHSVAGWWQVVHSMYEAQSTALLVEHRQRARAVGHASAQLVACGEGQEDYCMHGREQHLAPHLARHLT